MRILSFVFLTVCLSFESTPAFAESLTCNKKQTALTCMICNCYHETRGEPLDGKVAVTKVVLSRSEDEDFPSSICGVVFEQNQFSWTNDRVSNNIKATREDDRDALDQCRKAVDISTREGANDVLYFYNPQLAAPGWARRMKKCGRVGNHSFLVPRSDRCPKKLGVSGRYTDSSSEKGTYQKRGVVR